MDPMMDGIEHVGGSAILSVALIQLLKRLDVPGLRWLNANADKAQHLIAIFMAIISAIGVSFTMEGSFMAGGHAEFAWPAANVMYEAIMRASFQYLVQRSVYAKLFKP